MTRSGMTVEELRLAAKLIGPGWWYDQFDHTFTHDDGEEKILDADTMENIEPWGPREYNNRLILVANGTIGAKDA